MLEEIAYDDLPASVGRSFGPTPPLLLSQALIGGFADLTNDHQWVHVDVSRAEREIGHTIAHGYLLLSLVPQFTEQLIVFTGVAKGLNYGLNRVRFVAVAPGGSAIVGTQTIIAVEPKAGGLLVTSEMRISDAAAGHPVCIAEILVVVLPGEGRL